MTRYHKNPSYEDRIALAPYNFVPLPERVLEAGADVSKPESHHEYAGYTGCFECEIETCSPLYIRGMITDDDMKADKQGKDQPHFFSVDGGRTPRIPGSSLRGLIRALVEIVSYSKMRWVMNRRLVYRAVDTTSLGRKYRERIMEEGAKNNFTPRVCGGYMRQRQGEWYIQPAENIGGTTFARINIARKPRGLQRLGNTQNAYRIYVQLGPYQYQDVREGFLHIRYTKVIKESSSPATGLREAALIESGYMKSKRSEAVIFAPDAAKTGPGKGWIAVNDTDAAGHVLDDRVADYRNQITDQQKAILGPDGVLCDGQPVFYLMEGSKLVFFGHTMMMRVPYKNSPLDMLPADLRKDDVLDLADAVFGYVRETADADDRHAACSGRVFFSDARCVTTGAPLFEGEITPKVLSTPKPTSFQHYVEQPTPDDKTKLQDYDQAQYSLRGHKLYWHHGNLPVERIVETDTNKLRHKTQYTRVRPVRSGVKFAFTLRFENLSAVELGALGWVLQIAADERYRLKLGMGKPLGMGAVCVTSKVHLTDRPARYSAVFSDAGGWLAGAIQDADAENDLCQAATAFEKWVLGERSEINRGSASRLSQLPRIIELLRLLEWPGPDPKYTHHMEIERRDNTDRKINEYRNRPVLPDPSFVADPHYVGNEAPVPRRADEEDEGPARANNVSTSPQPVKKPEPEPLPEVRENVSPEAKRVAEQLARANRVSEGELVTAIVVKLTGNDYECQLAQGDKTLCKLPRDEVKGLKVGDTVRTKVKRVAISGAVILTMRGVPKE
jgi:CRISPR-associated protein (TIGR03986 family)